jgi:hypothetical protein
MTVIETVIWKRYVKRCHINGIDFVSLLMYLLLFIFGSC